MNTSLRGPDAFFLGRLKFEERDEAARLIHASLATWYASHLNQPDRFGEAWEPFRIIPEIYGQLDPDCGIVAQETGTGALLGVCFYHPRSSHVSIGIVATKPGAGGRGVARAMLEEAARIAGNAGLPMRLVSSLMNLDSFSLYTRMGFVPDMVFQDLQFPAGILPCMPAITGNIRPASVEDIALMQALERELTGLDREQDFRFFIANEAGCWHTLLFIGLDGTLKGYLGSIHSGGTQMLGPGLMRDDVTALALIAAQLHHHAPGNPVVLVPARQAGLVASLYQAGARNVELHISQVRGPGISPRGIVIPTFLPESG